MNSIDRLIAIRTMRAVEQASYQQEPSPTPPRSRWERWKALIHRIERKLL